MSAEPAQLRRLRDGVVELCEQFDTYFPGLQTHPQVVHAIYELLDARIAAAAANRRKLGRAPLAAFVDAQLAQLRLSLEEQVDTDEAADVFVRCADELFMWCRRHELVSAEAMRVSVLARRDGRVLLGRRDGSEDWMLAGGERDAHESPQEAAARAFASATGIALGDVHGPVGFTYHYREQDAQLTTTMFMVAECAAGTPPVRPDGVAQWGWWPVGEMPAPLAQLAA